ncbi:Histidinol-phosphate aminotransferase [Planctomycetes bacterium Poly30]|uniref:histidinol-phosphate transaminase n=1 Tax=Saltatorellus ferox TaxID=2528018 RepID=A0A518EPI0_9BACT|nr:Histidinol-phosphate aminotransferase [Planctomycetes bacterium Poly30]
MSSSTADPERAIRRFGPTPNPGVASAYRVHAPLAPTDLWLAGNEGRAPEDASNAALRFDSAALDRYPSTDALVTQIAQRYAVEEASVLVTAGADDGLLRLALAYLAEGREIVLPTPTFVMIERYARLAGGTVVTVDWPAGTPYPTQAVLAAVTERTSLVAMVSPNNPTGGIATPEDLAAVSEGAPHALVIVDCAYAEFASRDLSLDALSLPNTVVLRTFSKAYGCAGLRVGYVLGEPDVIEALRAAGNPYPCASPSLAAAAVRFDADVAPFVRQVRQERAELRDLLEELGFESFASDGNFVYAEGARARIVVELLTGLGIAVRSFPAENAAASAADALRITCPGDPAQFERLRSALLTIERPEAILFDMDGVLVDVSGSYRRAIIETARRYGVTVSGDDIETLKSEGNANDDWRVTQRLLEAAGVAANLEEVTARFEALYQGTEETPGLKATETLLLGRDTLRKIAASWKLGIVTGRPLADAMYFLELHGIADLFDVVITRDDAPLKPDPAPTRLALERLGVRRAWLLGDTPDDLRSARGANVLPVGVLAPPLGEDDPEPARRVLRHSGAGTVLDRTTDLLEILP